MSLPSIVGRMECSVADHERACLVLIEEEQRKPRPDTHLISVLCDSVRLGREFCELAQARMRDRA